MPLTFANFPLHDAISAQASEDDPRQLITRPWVDWFTAQNTRLDQTPNRAQSVQLSGQQASIGTTPIQITNFGTGLYRLTYYARISQAATTNSSLTVSLAWTDGAVSCGFSGTAMTTNTTNTVQGNTIMVRSDNPPVLTYATTYASTGATPMQYNLDIVLEVIQASS